MKTYDLIIVGAGPAGITAGVYAARGRMDFLIISLDVGGQAAWSGDIENYTGYQFISGIELMEKFQEHMRRYDMAFKEKEEVLEISGSGNLIAVKTDKEVYQCRSLIIASGKRSKELGVPGEKEFKNRGLTYCATCDGPLFSGKDVAVIGGGNSALDAALQLIKIAKHVYIVHNARDLSGDAIMIQKVRQAPNVTVIDDSLVVAVSGGRFLSGIKIRSASAERDLAVQGVFVEIGLVPNSAFFPGIKKNSSNEIIVDSRNRTSLKGVFAAGDVTDVPEKQIIVAAGEGAKAALGAFKFLATGRF